MDISKYLEMGSSQLGLTGKELRKWCDEMIKDEERRMHEEEERNIAAQNRKLEEMKMKSELLEKEAKLEQLRLERVEGQESRPSLPSVGITVPRLPLYNEKESIDSFLVRFERIAQTHGWDEQTWAIHLSTILTGKGLEAYSRLSYDQAADYACVKQTLMETYNLTANTFKEKFRDSRPDLVENMAQFQTRIEGYFDKWVSLAGKDINTASDVKDLVIQEQMFNSCNTSLQIFVNERQPSDSKALGKIVDTYICAHGRAGAFSRSSQAVNKSVAGVKPKRDNDISVKSKGCFVCGKGGHLAKDCRKATSDRPNLVCSYCNKTGHSADKCFKKKRELSAMATVNVERAIPADHNGAELREVCHVQIGHTMPVVRGTVNGHDVNILRDSGSSCVVVRRELVEPVDDKAPRSTIKLANGHAITLPIVEVDIDSLYFKGCVTAVAMKQPLYDVIIGNIPGALCPGVNSEVEEGICRDTPQESTTECTQAVVTHDSKKNKTKLLKTSDVQDVGITRRELIDLQLNDESLNKVRTLAEAGETRRSGNANETRYALDKGVLVRYFKSPKVECGNEICQIVVPQSLRDKVMSLGHESILAGHLGTKKTVERIMLSFYWPQIWQDVTRYCRSCDQCQRSTYIGKEGRAPMENLPLIDEPFSRVAIDLIGPILPASERGYRYILTMVDFSSRYPDAVALKSIDTVHVAEALVEMFSRVGVPKELLSDRGCQLTSELMKEISRLLSIKQLVTSPYHPQCNGLVERFNGTLKMMLKKMTTERPRDWDRYIPAALFAYREAPQEALGFSPFELLYGRTPRGPMAILKEIWLGTDDAEVKTTYQYVVDLKARLEQTMNLARESLKKANKRNKTYFDKRSRNKKFKLGEKVLLLLPTARNKLELKWSGPYDIIEVRAHNNYQLLVGDQYRTYHANMLKAYMQRANEEHPSEKGILKCAAASVITEVEDCDELGKSDLEARKVRIEMPNFRQEETLNDVVIDDGLTGSQRTELMELLSEFQDILTDVPGRTSWIEHSINLTNNEPVRKKPYPVPQAFKEEMRKEVEKMLKADIIEPSMSPYSSPSVVVKKKDGTNRYCIDFRALNSISVFDAEPLPRADDLFQEIGSDSKYLTKIDLSKGYWQIPLTEDAKPLTAFATELGLYQFKVMPFGLQGAPATFSRLMRKVVVGLEHTHNYLDDCLIHTKTWDEHVQCLRKLFGRLRQAGLSARPSKCFVGFQELEFLGHIVGNGKMHPTLDKMKALQDAVPPVNKKEMRSFIGLLSFYRRYVPNFAALACPLTDANRKGKPNIIEWNNAQIRAYNCLKNALISEPVLRLADFDNHFFLQTDASDVGLGAILLQEHEGERFPVIFLSRKLLPPERNYSVIEKECLALVWAIKSLDSYLQGREFTILTDHAPLLYLNKARNENGRVLRWALTLNHYRFRIQNVAGKDNHGPDFLSRCHDKSP